MRSIRDVCDGSGGGRSSRKGSVTGILKTLETWKESRGRHEQYDCLLKDPQVKEVYETEVYLGMIADVHSSDRAAEAKAKAVKVTSFSGEGKEAAYVGNIMDLVEKIEKTGQNIQVDNLGETDFVVTYRRKGRKAASGSG